MKSQRTGQRAVCAAAIAAAFATAGAGSVQAEIITFNSVTPGIVFEGDSVSESGYTLTAGDGFGVVDTSAAFGSTGTLNLAGAQGNAGPFYIGLNDSFVRLEAGNGRAFKVASFDFGFVSALSNLFNPGEVPGFMVAAFEEADGALGAQGYSFGAADASGRFSFQTAQNLASGAWLRSVEFFACTDDGAGNCAIVNANFSQFALDNIQLVPEPGSLGLALAALALTAGFNRRKN